MLGLCLLLCTFSNSHHIFIRCPGSNFQKENIANPSRQWSHTETARAAMVRCVRCCLNKSMKIVNLIMLFFGIVLLIYSLWMTKEWHIYLTHLLPNSSPPRPWFIYASLGVGIAVCLSTLCSYMTVIYIGSYTLCSYIFILCCPLFLEVAAVVIIFFKMDISAQIAESIDKEHSEEFERFVSLHLKISRVIILLILVLQIKAVALAVMFWGIGTEPMTCGNRSYEYHFTQSFLVPRFPDPDSSVQACTCTRCENLQQENPQPGILPKIVGITRHIFQRDQLLV
ncbi:tetraspanin-19 isoform X2 [Jatropha curcas]|uniref:tetraspanin-19 isoform X2 n=1 Tax=Jatropha curcas TaxID=180498 RepID=UPI0009D71369|nr:tetraspanin-19 isoform X2 [Jatropha curcas]